MSCDAVNSDHGWGTLTSSIILWPVTTPRAETIIDFYLLYLIRLEDNLVSNIETQHLDFYWDLEGIWYVRDQNIVNNK